MRSTPDPASREAWLDADREKQILAVFRNRYGTIDSLKIDFRHEKLEGSDWLPPVFDNLPVKPRNAPFIWFPWFGRFDKDGLSAVARAKVARAHKEPASSRYTDTRKHAQVNTGTMVLPAQTINEMISKYIAENTPECEVFEGDEIRVHRVEVKPVGTPLDHIHDREIREVYLCVRRSGGGSPEILRTPMIYTGRTQIFPYHIWNHNFDKIVDRMLKHFKLSSLREMPHAENDGSPAYVALRKAFAVASANKGPDFQDCYAITTKCRTSEEEFHDGSDIWYTVNDAMMMGYLWAMHEVEPHIKGYAEHQRKKEEATRVRVKASRKSATDAKDTWHKIAAKIINDLLLVRPNSTNIAILETIKNDDQRWHRVKKDLDISEKVMIPSHSSLENFVSEYMAERARDRASDGARTMDQSAPEA